MYPRENKPLSAAGTAILLRMQTDPVEEWRRLNALYSEMGDVEIRELAAQINDLTPNAQQILRDELKKRGMNERGSSALRTASAQEIADPTANSDAQIHWEPSNYTYVFSELPNENDGPHEYTWKTELCTRDTAEEAWQLGEMLKRAGIDSWIQGPNNRAGLDGSRIMVAADQLELARGVIGQPIAQDILDKTKEEEEAPQSYESPVCPKCHASEPTLESVEPSNNWLCESCGYTWSDPVGDASASTQPTS